MYLWLFTLFTKDSRLKDAVSEGGPFRINFGSTKMFDL